MRWLKGLWGRWEAHQRRQVVAHEFERLHAAAEIARDPELAELATLVHEFWQTGRTEAAVNVLRAEKRALSRQPEAWRRPA